MLAYLCHACIYCDMDKYMVEFMLKFMTEIYMYPFMEEGECDEIHVSTCCITRGERGVRM